ncbi:hypothetical protein HaLaN_08768 [Haematococcus lacustris]|uniref:Uncharacterized protein n=1 Tax=Haematococcus lacustris TaxID=44745 RepID=A0A699Z125_HAELA|nr:hypothetical protein HaLaN_08768 [Haematococcus lacustris]
MGEGVQGHNVPAANPPMSTPSQRRKLRCSWVRAPPGSGQSGWGSCPAAAGQGQGCNNLGREQLVAALPAQLDAQGRDVQQQGQPPRTAATDHSNLSSARHTSDLPGADVYSGHHTRPSLSCHTAAMAGATVTGPVLLIAPWCTQWGNRGQQPLPYSPAAPAVA